MKTLLAFVVFFTTLASVAQTKPSMRYEDKIRIKEARTIEKKFGEQLWKGYTKSPIAIILIDNDYEYLIDHPNPSKDFLFLEKDSLLGVNIHYRKQQFNKAYLATFPAVNGIPCIVVGIPENSNRTSTEWIITILHERFHQYQQNTKNYYKESMDLGLSNGDQSGMWQLNYPFPYEDKATISAYKSYTIALKKAIEMLQNKNFDIYFNQFRKAREKFKNSLKENDYKFFSFQLYQEGIARYTEYGFLDLMKDYSPSKEVQKIKDFTSFKEYKQSFYKKRINNVIAMQLQTSKRVCFYDLGFAEALLINKVNPNWRDQYLLDKFDISMFYPKD